MAYRDPNYDPQKAHEYYEKHKKLKGRRSTKGFSQSQKERLAYAKYQLGEDKKQQISEISEQRKALAAEVAATIKEKKAAATKQAQAQIQRIRNKLKAMRNASPERKAQMRDMIAGAVASIRESAKQTRDQLTAQGKAAREDLSAQAKSAKENVRQEYEKKVDEAYEKIRRG